MIRTDDLARCSPGRSPSGAATLFGLCAFVLLGCPGGGGGEDAPRVASVQRTTLETGVAGVIPESAVAEDDVVVFWGGFVDVATSLHATRIDLPAGSRPPVAAERQPAFSVGTDGRFVSYRYMDGSFLMVPPIRAKVIDMQGTSGGAPYPTEDWSPFPGERALVDALDLADGWLVWIAAPDSGFPEFIFGLTDLESGTNTPVRTFGPVRNGRRSEIRVTPEAVAWADEERVFVLPPPFDAATPIEVGERTISSSFDRLIAEGPWVFWREGGDVMAFDARDPLVSGVNPVKLGPPLLGPRQVVDVAFDRVLLQKNLSFYVVRLGDEAAEPELAFHGNGGAVVLGDGWLLTTSCGDSAVAIPGEPACRYGDAPETVLFAFDLSQPLDGQVPVPIVSGLRSFFSASASRLGFAWREYDTDGTDFIWFFNPREPVVAGVNPARVAGAESLEGGPALSDSGLVYVERDAVDSTYSFRYVDAASLLVATVAAP